MTGLLHNDGSFVIFIVQHRYERKGDWTFSGAASNFASNIPSELRHEYVRKEKGVTATGSFIEPFRSFSACGECWQKTGISGSFRVEDADQLVELLKRYNPVHDFRTARLETSQLITPTGQGAEG